MYYLPSTEDGGAIHRFRPVATSLAVNNHVISRTLAKDVQWKTVSKGLDTWEKVGRWLMIAYAFDDLCRFAKGFSPIVVTKMQSGKTVSWTVLKGTVVPSRLLSRVIIVYPAVNPKGLAGYALDKISICREFDMYSSI